MRSNLLINPCMPIDEITKIFESWVRTGFTITDLDIEKFDRSIPAILLVIFALLLLVLGMPDDIVIEMIAISFNKTACDAEGNSMSLYAEVCSGLWSTILGNGFCSYVSVRLSGIMQANTSGAFEGDDSHICSKPIQDLAVRVARMNANFGMTSKLVAPDVPYFLGHFMENTEEGVVPVVDPMRQAEKFSAVRTLADRPALMASWRVNRQTLHRGVDTEELAIHVAKKYKHFNPSYNIIDALMCMD